MRNATMRRGGTSSRQMDAKYGRCFSGSWHSGRAHEPVLTRSLTAYQCVIRSVLFQRLVEYE
jgi:hypothetical protein